MRPARTSHNLRDLIAVAVLLMVCSPAAAQNGQNRERARQELQRTDELLQHASSVVHETDSIRARDLVETARGIQQNAWKSFDGDHLLVAGRMTLEARELASRAVNLAREDAVTRERAVREMERASREIGRAREHLDGATGAEARRLLEEAT